MYMSLHNAQRKQRSKSNLKLKRRRLLTKPPAVESLPDVIYNIPTDAVPIELCYDVDQDDNVDCSPDVMYNIPTVESRQYVIGQPAKHNFDSKSNRGRSVLLG